MGPRRSIVLVGCFRHSSRRRSGLLWGASEVSVAKTADRSVIGTMNEFAFLAEVYRERVETTDLLALSVRLADTPCSAIGQDSPARLIKKMNLS